MKHINYDSIEEDFEKSKGRTIQLNLTKKDWEDLKEEFKDISKPMFDDDLCNQFFVMFMCGKGDFINRMTHLVNSFLDDNWASRTDPRVMKEGFSANRTYNEDTINWFRGAIQQLCEKRLKQDTKKLSKILNSRKG